MFNLKSKAKRRPWCDSTAVRHWHNPADPIQAARIEAAAVKRARRADKLEEAAENSWHYNHAHDSTSLSLDPFFVAK